MKYKISKINLRDINSYLYTLNKTRSKNSIIQNKIKRINHYNWWFENIRLKNIVCIKIKKNNLFLAKKNFKK